MNQSLFASPHQNVESRKQAMSVIGTCAAIRTLVAGCTRLDWN
jgi:hypothetical protein